jgi:general secretion pathway protein N
LGSIPAATQQLALVGAIAGEDGEGIAILIDGLTKEIIRLKTGETYSGWTLQSVRPREVTIQKEQKTAILVLPSSLAK